MRARGSGGMRPQENFTLSEMFLVQSWDETARFQHLAAKPSQNEHTIGPVDKVVPDHNNSRLPQPIRLCGEQ